METKFDIEKAIHGAVIALQRRQPFDATLHYTYALAKLVDYVTQTECRTGAKAYECVLVDIQTYEIYRDVWFTDTTYHRLATENECKSVGKRFVSMDKDSLIECKHEWVYEGHNTIDFRTCKKCNKTVSI